MPCYKNSLLHSTQNKPEKHNAYNELAPYNFGTILSSWLKTILDDSLSIPGIEHTQL